MEEASGRELGWFFDQWLYKPGTLKVAGRWRYNAAARQLELELDQVQTDGSLFTMPIEVGIRSKGQAVESIHRVQLAAKSNRFTIDLPTEPESVRLDPGVWVLMDATLERSR